jgi:hypothetical protein
MNFKTGVPVHISNIKNCLIFAKFKIPKNLIFSQKITKMFQTPKASFLTSPKFLPKKLNQIQKIAFVPRKQCCNSKKPTPLKKEHKMGAKKAPKGQLFTSVFFFSVEASEK